MFGGYGRMEDATAGSVANPPLCSTPKVPLCHILQGTNVLYHLSLMRHDKRGQLVVRFPTIMVHCFLHLVLATVITNYNTKCQQSH
jgi:hypothetical protein